MKIEVIVQNAEDARSAEKLGAHRLELVSAISEGGLTPSYGTIKKVIEAVNIPIQVMLRPHSHSFVYSANDWEIIKEDLSIMKELGVQGVVFGCLNEKKQIDIYILEKFLKLADGMDITFHRAIDEASDIQQAYQTLINYSAYINRVLTSGGVSKVEEGLEELKELILLSQQEKGPTIMPGSGLSVQNIQQIHKELGATEYHFGSGVRNMGSFNNGFADDVMTKVLNLLV